MSNVMLIAQLFMAAKEIVKVVEQAMPESGKGREKLAAAKQLLEAAGVLTEAAAPYIDTVIAVVVALYNASGVFKKG